MQVLQRMQGQDVVLAAVQGLVHAVGIGDVLAAHGDVLDLAVGGGLLGLLKGDGADDADQGCRARR